MSRMHPRRARFGVEALESRKLMASDFYLESAFDGIKGETVDSRPQPAEVEVQTIDQGSDQLAGDTGQDDPAAGFPAGPRLWFK